MAAADNKTNPETQTVKAISLPKAEQAVIIGAEGSAQLPARPSTEPKSGSSSEPKSMGPNQDSQTKTLIGRGLEEKPSLSYKESKSLNIEPSVLPRTVSFKTENNNPHLEAQIKNRIDNKLIKDQHKQDSQISQAILSHRIQDVAVLVARAEQERSAILTTLFAGEIPDRQILAIADSMLQLGGNAAILARVGEGDLSREALATHLLTIIQQQRSFDCTHIELGMLDSLEFQLISMLQQINPTTRPQPQQQVQTKSNNDDDGGGGPDKVDEDDRESGLGASEDSDLDSDTSYSPRSKKSRARARARDRRSRFKKWLERMLRAFGRQNLNISNSLRGANRTAVRLGDKRFVPTVRIFGKVVDEQSGVGIRGVQIISTLGTVITAADGGFAFENVNVGSSYSIAPIKYGYNFKPQAINDVALDYREHIFLISSDL